MGRDKSRLRLDGKTLLQRIQESAGESELLIRIIRRDVLPRCGPLGGIATAFCKSEANGIVFLSCDMPFVSPTLVSELLEQFQKHKCAVFCGTSDFGFPFVLPKSALRRVHEQIESGEFSLQALAKKLRARMIAPPPDRTDELFNINTPDDLIRAKHILKGLPPEPVLEVRKLTIRRGRTMILDNLNWQVRPGENWVILGANGSGKTSLLTALMGYLTPTSGVVRVLGREYGRTDWRELRRHIGLVSSAVRQMMGESEPALLSVVSGKYAQIDYWGTPKTGDRKEAARILEQVECGYLADRPWAYLSQGERQRVLIGRALMAKPAILILDEPCAGLDPAARENFLGFLQRLSGSRSAPSLVLVTHHVEEIVPAFTHALLLKSGLAFAQGRMKKVLTSSNLSDLFSTPMRLRKIQSRYQLALSGGLHW